MIMGKISSAPELVKVDENDDESQKLLYCDVEFVNENKVVQ
jgi:hypothetical protein